MYSFLSGQADIKPDHGDNYGAGVSQLSHTRTHTLRHHMDMQTVKRPNCRQLTCLRGGTSGISWSRIDPALIGLRAAIPQSPDKNQSFDFPRCLLLFIIICEYVTFEVMFDEVNLYGVFQTKPLLLVDRHNQSEVNCAWF